MRLEVEVGVSVVVVIVVFVRVGDVETRVFVVTCLSPSTIRVVEFERVVLPDIRDVVVVLLFAVRLVVVTVPRVEVLARVDELLLLLELILVLEFVVLARVVAVRVAFIFRVPDN